MKATKVDGVYDADPMTHPDAVKFDELPYIEVLNRGLKVMDNTAISLCMDNDLPIIVFNMEREGNIERALQGRAGRDDRQRRELACRTTIIARRRRAHEEGARAPRPRVHHRAHRPRVGARCSRTSRSSTTAARCRCSQVAAVKSPEPHCSSIEPWDKAMLSAHREGDPGLRPRPEPEQRRHDHPPAVPARSTRSAAASSSSCARATPRRRKVAVRNVRRDAIEHLEKREKDGEISQDDLRRGEAEIQKLTDAHIAEIDEMLKRKEAGDHGSLGRTCPADPHDSQAFFHHDARARAARVVRPRPRARARRHHHGRQRPLGREARPAAHRRAPRRREGDPRGHRRVRSSSASATSRSTRSARENWRRPEDEVKGLMALFVEVLEAELARLRGARACALRVIGRDDDLPVGDRATRSCAPRSAPQDNTGLDPRRRAELRRPRRDRRRGARDRARGRRRAARPGRHRRGRHRRAPLHRRASPIPTSSSARAARCASATSCCGRSPTPSCG